ncbi:hypothetical protein ACC715_37000, partial [Rhizobium ruizarguesonis]
PDLVYEFINPQYQNEFFPNRKALGKPLLQVMPEVAGKPIWDTLQSVYKTGHTFTGREICIQVANGTDGKLENHYFDVVYQAIR